MILDARLYLKRRKENPLTKYRLQRRIEKVSEVIGRYMNGNSNLRLLDIGAADGTMLKVLKDRFNLFRAVGVEPNEELIKAKVSDDVELIHGFGEALPFDDSQFDIVVLSATIEHTNEPEKVISESHRVLSENGLLILITVVPWMDKLAEKLGIFPKTLHRHFHRFSLGELRDLLVNNGFRILEIDKFALPSSGFIPFEKIVESILNEIHLNFLMSYELVIGVKNEV